MSRAPRVLPPEPSLPAVPPDVVVRTCPLPGDLLGLWDEATRTVWLHDDLTSAERRSTLVHELVHAERGDVPCGDDALDARQEARVEREAARRLLPIDVLADVVTWAVDPHEAAAELDVDVDVLTARLSSLTRAEQELLSARSSSGPASVA